MAVSSGGTQGVGDVWVAAAPKGGSLVSSRGWKAARLPLLSKVRTSGWSGNKFIPSEMFSAVSWGGTHRYLSHTQIHFTHPTEMAPSTWHQPCLEGFTEADTGDTGKTSPGVLPAGLSLGRPGVGSMPLPQPLHLRSFVPGL